MPTLEEVEREIARRGLGASTPSLDDVEREIARRGLGATPPAAVQAPLPAQAPPPATPTPQENPGIIGQLGSLVKQIPGIEQARQGAQAIMEHVPGMKAAQNVVDAVPLVDILGGERGATISGAEYAGRLGGGAVGTALGGPVGGAVGTTVGGMVGAGVGTWFDRMVRGEKVTAGDVAFEAGAAAVPDALIYGAQGAIRQGKRILTRTAKGIKESENLAATHLRQAAPDLIKPPSKEAVDQLFSMVHASGDRLNPNSLAKGFTNLTETQWKTVMQRLRKIPNPPGSRITDFGEAAERVLTRVREGKKSVQGLALGELQHVRSQIQQVKLSTADGAAKDALQMFQDTIDDAMLNTKNYLNGGGADVQTLLQAREGFRKLKETEEVSEFLWSATSKAKQGDRLTVNLGKLSDALAHPKKGVQQKAVAALERAPGAVKELQTFLKNMGEVNITPGYLASLTGGVGRSIAAFGGAGALTGNIGLGVVGTGAIAMQMMAEVLSVPAARAQFNAIVLRNQARTGVRTIAFPMLATLANNARRSVLGQTQAPQPAIPNMVQ